MISNSFSFYSPRAAFVRPRDYWALFKPRVMALVIFSGSVGIFLAPGRLHPVMIMAAILCLALGAAGAATLNMALEADLDARMQRTRRRPIPSGKISSSQAAGLGVTLSVLSVLMMELWFNITAAATLALTILFYVGIYTLFLKRNTPQNIVIGGAAGALPPLVGWACVTNSLSVFPFLIFLIIFFWTPPHFWALCLVCDADYRKAGVPMHPIVYGKTATLRAIVGYTLLLGATSTLPTLLGFSSYIYLVSALILGAGFLFYALRLWQHMTRRRALSCFFYSIAYLFLLLLALVVDHIYLPL